MALDSGYYTSVNAIKGEHAVSDIDQFDYSVNIAFAHY